MPAVTVYTDGGCRPNPGVGGWAAVLLFGQGKQVELKGRAERSTNNRMELTAAVKALASLEAAHKVTLYTDSQYLRRGITEWLEQWQRAGWMTAANNPVQNQDLWQALTREIQRHRVDWHWVKGHAANRYNERADELASSMIGAEKLPISDPEAVHLYTAAAFSGKTGVGAWGVVLQYQDSTRELAGTEQGTSANRMHLQAAIQGLGALKRPLRVHVYTSSDYLKDGATAWLAGWQRRGWRTRDGKPVRHQELWRRLAGLLRRLSCHWHVVARQHQVEGLEQAKQLATAKVRECR